VTGFFSGFGFMSFGGLFEEVLPLLGGHAQYVPTLL
jgi:hypothetical protein